MSVIGIIIGALVGAIFSGLVLWVVGKLGWGIEVDGFGPAYLAAVIIAILSAVVHWIWQAVFNYTPPAGLAGAVSNLLVAAILLQFVGGRIKGLRVKGFSGAIIAALAVAAVAWVIGLVLTAVVA